MAEGWLGNILDVQVQVSIHTPMGYVVLACQPTSPGNVIPFHSLFGFSALSFW